jgi:hypothetical protein
VPEQESRIQRLEDEWAIARVLEAYGRGLDYGLEDVFLDCWLETAVWLGTEMPRPPGEPTLFFRVEGLDAIRDIFSRHSHAPDVYHKHVFFHPLIEIDGDRATSEAYFFRVDDHEVGAYIRIFGRYVDQFVRCADGRWRIAERHVERESRHPLAKSSILQVSQ